MCIQKMDTDLNAYGVDLASVLVWAIREQQLPEDTSDTMEFNIKLDGQKYKTIPLNFYRKLLIMRLQK